jgi:iron complex outermembrane receptor protein
MRRSQSIFLRAVSASAFVTAMAVLAPTAAIAADGDQASEAPTNGVQDIVVTAQRRDQRLQDVGVSVTALSNDSLRKLGVVDSRDLVKAAPGVQLESTAGGGVNAFLTIRGISQSDYSANQESPNSIYLDEVYLSSPNAAAFTMYDLQRVEILRGPQGTLFGRASSGGLASFITARPGKTWSGYAEVGYASFNNVWAEAAVGGPISDRVRFRVSGRTESADGWFLNGMPGGKASYEKKFAGIRGQLEADLTDRLTARLSVSYDRNPSHREGAYRRVAYAYDANGQPYFTPDQPAALTGYVNPYKQFNKGDFNDYGRLSNERFSPTLYLTYDLGGATVSSISNYTKFKFKYEEDCDGSPLDACNFGYSQNLDQYSQELRVNGKTGGLTYTAGAYYLKIDQIMPQFFKYPAFSGTPYGFSDTNIVKQNLDSWALFGQLEYKLTDKLAVTGGLRYTHETKDFDSKAYLQEYGVIYDPEILAADFSKATVGALARQSEGLWTGKVQLDYKPTDHTLIYASVSRGAKPGGFNTNLSLAISDDRVPFKSEHLWAYEGGLKTQLLDNHLRVNASGFYYNYSRFQGFALVTPQSVVGNYDGYFYGGELEITAVPAHNLDIGLAASYLKTKLRDVGTIGPNGVGSVVLDQESIMAPRWTVYGQVTKAFDLPFGQLSLNWNGNYIAKRYASIDNSPTNLVPAVFMHSARATLSFDAQKLELSLFINNISNQEKIGWVQRASDGVVYAYDKPRWIGGSIRKSF